MRTYEVVEVARCVVRVLRDSERTEDIHRIAEITGADLFTRLADAGRRGIAGRGADYDALLRERPEIDGEHVDFAALRRLPADTLGGAYVAHLDRYGLDVYVTATPDEFIKDADARYLLHRFRQTHDIWHALLGLGVQGHEEVLVHAFSFGQLRLPVSALIMGFGAIKHFVLERRWPALRRAIRAAYASGRDAAPLLPVRWEAQWEAPIEAIRGRYRITPAAPAWGL
ncbi:MAG: Coq4 family protein [Nannocystaceae bacterium]